MSAPQMKERPASVLRAMFAGFGSLMSVMDKMRSKPAAEAPTGAEASAPQTPVAPAAVAPAAEPAVAEPVVAEPVVAEPVVAEATVEADTTPKPDTTAEPVAVAAEPVVVAPESVTEPETTTKAEAAAEPGVAAALPLANYDELTVASLRARLRNLSNDDINQLVAYEQAHQNRPEVIKMFNNRLIKMTSGLPKLES
jgi:cytoskeletal protein RodZ